MDNIWLPGGFRILVQYFSIVVIVLLSDCHTYRWNMPAKCFFGYFVIKAPPWGQVAQNFAQRRRGSWLSRGFSSDSDTPLWRYAPLPVVTKIYRKLFLITWVLFGISKFVWPLFVRIVHGCYMQIFVCISQMPYEERSKQVMYHISR